MSKKKRSVGRPKWEPPPRAKYLDGCAQIEKGATVETVSRVFFGGERHTVAQFMRDNPYHLFTTAIRDAQDTSNLIDEKNLRAMSLKDFRALRMRLINRHKEAWQDRVEMTGEDGGPIEVNAKMPSVHDLIKALKGARKT